MKIDVSDLIKKTSANILALEKETVVVGVAAGYARNADLRPGKFRQMPNHSGTKKVRALKRGGYAKIKLTNLAKILDKDKGIFTEFETFADNQDVIAVAQQFAVMDKSQQDIKRLENACRAMVRNPILRGSYGPNSKAWIKRKGFDNYGISTGTLFGSIEARFNRA